MCSGSQSKTKINHIKWNLAHKLKFNHLRSYPITVESLFMLIRAHSLKVTWLIVLFSPWACPCRPLNTLLKNVVTQKENLSQKRPFSFKCAFQQSSHVSFSVFFFHLPLFSQRGRNSPPLQIAGFFILHFHYKPTLPLSWTNFFLKKHRQYWQIWMTLYCLSDVRSKICHLTSNS